MIDGAPSRNAHRHLHQLEVHKLLQCGDEVVCPKDLNGGLEPVLLLLPKLPIRDMDTLGGPVCEPSLLQVNLPSVRARDQMPITPAPCRASTLPSSLHSAMECPSKTSTHPSMADELQELLSQAVLDTSSPASEDSTPRRPGSLAQGAPLTIRVEEPLRPDRSVLATPKLMATSQQTSLQAATPNDAIPISHLPSPILESETPKVASISAASQSETHLGTGLGCPL